ncbi:uncharacterized protein LOC128186358 [Crassostrea angulata]|uniref:uncharacterized protein LOC128186358 n=1 Tax=Magallana angulata TaxID=2784310 RepID=UPI0022B0C1C5|nr:uncharacterized protein LOC128186358 [Crassostrea angulata]
MLVLGVAIACVFFCDSSVSAIQTFKFELEPGRQGSLLTSPDLRAPVQAFSLLHCSAVCATHHCRVFFYNRRSRYCYLLQRQLKESDTFTASAGTRVFRVTSAGFLTLPLTTTTTSTTTTTTVRFGSGDD